MESDCETIDNKILNEKFVNLFRSGYVSVKGITLPERFKDFYKAIENFEVFDDDVWVCSFPKTGTTWTQEMAWMIKENFNLKEASKSLLERFPFFDFSHLFDYRRVWEKYPDFNPDDYLVDSLKFITELKRPRYIKTHLPWCLLPKQIQNGTRQPKIVYAIRNPKDVCVSYYHHSRCIEGYTGGFDEFCDLFLEGKVPFGPFWTHVSQCWERRNQPNITIFKFEDLKKDLPACIRQMTKFLGKNLNEVQMEFLTNHLSFDSMKNNKAVTYDHFYDLHRKYKLIASDSTHIRSGGVNVYKDEMNAELIRKFDAWMEKQPCSKEIGYA